MTVTLETGEYLTFLMASKPFFPISCWLMAIDSSKLEISSLQFAQNCVSHIEPLSYLSSALHVLLEKVKYNRPSESSLCIEGAAVGICWCMSQAFLLIISFEEM